MSKDFRILNITQLRLHDMSNIKYALLAPQTNRTKIEKQAKSIEDGVPYLNYGIRQV